LFGWLRPGAALSSLLLAGGVFGLALKSWWLVAVMLVIAVELWGVRGAAESRGKKLLARVPAILAGCAVALIIAVSLRMAAQVAIVLGYAVWRWWWLGQPNWAAGSLGNLLGVQIVVFEALFLMAAEWRGESGVPEWLVLLLVWICAYLPLYSVLVQRGERAAGVMAATWALVATEISWVLLRWLFVYTVSGGYLLVPQPALILSALGYCYGSIYVSQRQGKLSRARLTEYVLIALVLIAVVTTGTPWRGTI
jgi:hypothetical protein